MDKTLTEKQLLAVQMLSKGFPISQVAEVVQVNRGTIYKWINMNEFKKQKEKLEKEIVEEFRLATRLELNEILANGKNQEKLRAIELILKLTGEFGKDEEPIKKDLSVEEILANLGV